MINGTKQCTAMASNNQRYIYIVIRHFWPIPVDNWHHIKSLLVVSICILSICVGSTLITMQYSCESLPHSAGR